MKKILKNNSAFTLVELMVAIAIISTSMVAIFSLIIQNIQVQKVNKDTLTASMLAQEGVELVRSVRDENWLTPLAEVWDGIDEVDNTFSIDFNFAIDRVPNIPTDSGARLYLNGNNFYDHTVVGGTPTQFYRLITIAPSGLDTDGDGNDDYMSVSSQVQWMRNGHPKNYVAETLLYDWR